LNEWVRGRIVDRGRCRRKWSYELSVVVRIARLIARYYRSTARLLATYFFRTT
jgi:hypothetical protein